MRLSMHEHWAQIERERERETEREREREREEKKLTVHSPAPCTPRMHAVPGVYERGRRGVRRGTRLRSALPKNSRSPSTLESRWSFGQQPRTSVKRGEWSGFMQTYLRDNPCVRCQGDESRNNCDELPHREDNDPAARRHRRRSSLVLVLDLLVSGELQLFFFVSAPCAEVQRRKKITKSNPPPSRMERVQITSCARDFDACVTPFFDFSISKYRSKRKKEAQPSTPCAEQSR